MFHAYYTHAHTDIYLCAYITLSYLKNILRIFLQMSVTCFIPHFIYQRHLTISMPRSSSFFLMANFGGKKLIYCPLMSFQVISSFFLLCQIMLQGTLSVPRCACAACMCARVVIKDGTNIYWVITLCQGLCEAPHILNHPIFATKS